MAFFETVKRGAKALGKDVAAKAKEAAEAPPPAARPGEQLTISYRPSDEKWLVSSPGGTTLRTFASKQAAINEAQRRIAATDKYTQYQVLKRNPSGLDNMVETRESQRKGRGGGGQSGGNGPSLPGFGAPKDDTGEPQVPSELGLGPQAADPDDSDDSEPYVPETFEF